MLGELETKEDTKEGQRWAVRIHKYLSIHLKIDFSYREKSLCINQCIIKMHRVSLITSAF